jgi:hypothetical protein
MAEPKSRLHIILAVLNFLNAGLATFLSLALLNSNPQFERQWGLLIGLPAAGLIGLGVCLLVRPKQAWLAAVAAVLLLEIHAIMLQHLGVRDMGDAMAVSFGSAGTALFGIMWKTPKRLLVVVALLVVIPVLFYWLWGVWFHPGIGHGFDL